jgi:hypothetical protein
MFSDFEFLLTTTLHGKEWDVFADPAARQVALCEVGGFPQDADSIVLGGQTAAEILNGIYLTETSR